MVADTMGGRMHVRWDETAQATPHGRTVFFAEFLATAGVFDRWVQGCPPHYSSPNASRSRDVLGTPMLAAVGRAASHGGQTMLYLAPMHAEVGLIKSMIANVHAAIQHVKAAAQQLPKIDRWAAMLAYICRRIVGRFPLPAPPPALAEQG